MGDGIGLSDIPDSSISSGGDLQVLLEICRGTGGTILILLVAGYSPGIKVGFENFGSEVVIIVLRVVPGFLKAVSAASQSTGHRKSGSPGSMSLVLQ